MEGLSWTIFAACVLAFALGLFFRKRSCFLNLPGPKALPLVGNLHQLNKSRLHVQLLGWAKQYGPVYRLRFGHKPVVIVTGSKQIHEVLLVKGKDFSGRPHSYLLRRVFGGAGMALADVTDQWKVQKKLLLSSLRGYGSGFCRIEKITTYYTNQWLEVLKAAYVDNDHGLDIREELVDLTYSVINVIALNEDLHSRENTTRIKAIANDSVSNFQRCLQFKGLLIDFCPLLRFLMPSLTNDIESVAERLSTLFLELKNNASTMIVNAEKGIGNISEGVLLSKMIQYQLGDNKLQLDDDAAMHTLMAAYGGGIATTSKSFAFLFNILAQNETIQVKIQTEIDSTIGHTLIKLEDKERMPYTQATLFEMLRFVSIFPTLIPHRSTTDTSIDGHHIPQDTEVWINAWGLHHDDAIWDQPFKFMPDRFLDACGAVVLADHPTRRNLVAFGAGLRVCPGETFAMSRMFLILTMFLQKFSVLPFSDDADQLTYDTREVDLGMLLEPPHCKLRLRSRCLTN